MAFFFPIWRLIISEKYMVPPVFEYKKDLLSFVFSAYLETVQKYP